MPSAVFVQTGCRLHFGLLAVQAEAGRNFGGVGLMIGSPNCEVLVHRNDHDEIVSSAELAPRIAEWRDRIRNAIERDSTSMPVRIELHRELPGHAGLGSGTQMALALATAMNAIAGNSTIAAIELASQVGRGRRSAIGIHGFQRGGFLVEAGKRRDEEVSPLVASLSFPAEWRILLASPKSALGLSGDAERQAFVRLGAMPRSVTEKLCRIALMDMLPAIAAADFQATSESLFEFGRLNGEYFAPVQGGLFADPRAASLADWLRTAGCMAVGQSSWGPSLFALLPNSAEAERFQHEITQSSLGNDFNIQITQARNGGATVTPELK